MARCSFHERRFVYFMCTSTYHKWKNSTVNSTVKNQSCLEFYITSDIFTSSNDARTAAVSSQTNSM